MPDPHAESETELGTDAAAAQRRKGIYLLPNLLTTGGLFAGFYAIVAGMGGRFEVAAVAVFIAMVMDGLDGRVARMTNTMSDFGKEYDSLADMVSFGLAPALVIYSWSLSELGKIGWLAAFIYAAAAALRLARFNTQAGHVDKRYFQGLASPAAAAVVAGLVWLCNDHGLSGKNLTYLAFFITILCGALMVSNIRYHSFKDLALKNRVPFVAMLIVVLIFVFVSLSPPQVLFVLFFGYALSGPILTLIQRRKHRAQRHPPPPPNNPS